MAEDYMPIEIPPRAHLWKGQRIRRLKDGHEFTVVFVNPKRSLFSAEAADDGRWHWGGPIPFARDIEVVHG